MTVTTVDPSNGASLATYAETPPEAVGALLQRGDDAAGRWGVTSPPERGEALRRLSASLRERREELALMATSEMGKPLVDSRTEVEKCAWACEWFADHGPAMLEPEAVDTGARHSYVEYT